MPDRRHRFRPSAEGVEPRLLLSAAHHPAAYTGTIHGYLVAKSSQNTDVSFESYAIVRAGGTITPFGKVGVVAGRVTDAHERNGVGYDEDFVDRSITFELTSRGKATVDVTLSAPFILPAEPLEPGNYPATIDAHGETKTLGTRVATLSLPKGPPLNLGSLEPFTLTFRVGGPG